MHILELNMEDIREFDTILGIKVKRKDTQISLSQSHYLVKILAMFQHMKLRKSILLLIQG